MAFQATHLETIPEGFRGFWCFYRKQLNPGFYLTPDGEIRPLFTDIDVTRWTPKALKASKELVNEFFSYLTQYTYDGRVGILFNSFGYAFDGGKTKTPGSPFAWVENGVFSDTSLVGVMAEVIEENPLFAHIPGSEPQLEDGAW